MPIILFFSLLLLPSYSFADTQPRVVTSIRPLQLITNEIMRGAGQAELLIDSRQSPHHFQLKPSQLRAATETDLLIWVSNEFETGLKRLQPILPAASLQLQLAEALSADRLIGDHHELDGHLWLSPQNVTEIAGLIAQQLSELNPVKQALYQHNTEQLIQKVTHWRQRSQRKLQQTKPAYILDHQFLAYFERDFGLNNSGGLRNNHNQGSSMRQLSVLHEQLQQSPVKCLLVTHLPISSQAEQISQRYRLKIKQLNTLGEATNHANIIDLLEDIVIALSGCE